MHPPRTRYTERISRTGATTDMVKKRRLVWVVGVRHRHQGKRRKLMGVHGATTLGNCGNSELINFAHCFQMTCVIHTNYCIQPFQL